MGTLLNRRRYMGGGSSLPYDAEIEYLQSTGTQWINTGVCATTEISVSIKVQMSAQTNNADYNPLGSRGSSQHYDFSIWMNKSSGKGIAVHKFYNEIASSHGREDSGWKYTGDITNNFHIIDITSQGYYVDNILCFEWTKSPQGLITSTYPLYLFAMFDSQGAYRRFNGKIAFCKIRLSNVLVFDAIPVRVGQTGYMYDRVSGNLFANAGTGSFTLGPDKIGGG